MLVFSLQKIYEELFKLSWGNKTCKNSKSFFLHQILIKISSNPNWAWFCKVCGVGFVYIMLNEKVTAYVKLELKAYLISRNGSKEVYLLTFIVESNFAILHYCTISTCPWFSESTEIKGCIPPCAANDSICVKSFKSYICKCPYGFNPSFGHKGVLLRCQGMTKLHVLVFWCHLKKKIETPLRLLSFKVKEKYPSGCC